jgi:sterol desaturase/sphingolipid hydroxylase (fatty acid hydroxylase superfamily)
MAIDMMAHCGYSFQWYESLSKVFDTTLNHDHHHEKFKPNYGVYLSIWDHLFDTFEQPRQGKGPPE